MRGMSSRSPLRSPSTASLAPRTRARWRAGFVRRVRTSTQRLPGRSDRNASGARVRRRSDGRCSPPTKDGARSPGATCRRRSKRRTSRIGERRTTRGPGFSSGWICTVSSRAAARVRRELPGRRGARLVWRAEGPTASPPGQSAPLAAAAARTLGRPGRQRTARVSSGHQTGGAPIVEGRTAIPRVRRDGARSVAGKGVPGR